MVHLRFVTCYIGLQLETHEVFHHEVVFCKNKIVTGKSATTTVTICHTILFKR